MLDEIQKIDGWSETVKGLWDADRASGCPLHVVILGSSPLLMQRGLNETLAGRFEPIRFTHWSYAEMSEAFGLGLERYVFFGGYPGAAPRIGDSERWAGYVRGALIEPNIERDVLSMTRVDKPALLKRLFYLGASYSGQVVSYTKLVGQLQDAGNTTTLTRYLDLLSQAGLLAGILEAHRAAVVGEGLNAKAERAQHGPDGGRLRLHVRRGSIRPHVLGSHGRERRRCASRQYGVAEHHGQVLEGTKPRSGLRPPARPARGRDRSEEWQRTRSDEGDGGVRAAIRVAPDRRRALRCALARVPIAAGRSLVRRVMNSTTMDVRPKALPSEDWIGPAGGEVSSIRSTERARRSRAGGDRNGIPRSPSRSVPSGTYRHMCCSAIPGPARRPSSSKESEALGDAALMLSARDFVTVRSGRPPGVAAPRRFFVDGLDEMRAGAVDARSTLD